MNPAIQDTETGPADNTGVPDVRLVFKPVAAGGGFVYQLPDGRRLARDVMERLADLGMVRKVFSERVNVCPKCGSGNVLFREVCPPCQGAGIDQPQVIHHFRCAGVFRAESFGDSQNMLCPKCRHQLRHVGVDHEFMQAEFVCGGCGRASSVAPTAGRCLQCDEHFPAEDAGVDDWYDYFPTEKWDDTLLGHGPAGGGDDALPFILIVDDVEDNLDLLEDLLEDQSVKLLRAMNGPDAISIVEKQELDLIILDVNMPEMDGIRSGRTREKNTQRRDRPYPLFDRLSHFGS